MRDIRTAQDAETIRQTVEDLAESRYAIDEGGHVNWQAFLDKVESYADVDLGSYIDSPAIRRIRKMVRIAVISPFGVPMNCDEK